MSNVRVTHRIRLKWQPKIIIYWTIWNLNLVCCLRYSLKEIYYRFGKERNNFQWQGIKTVRHSPAKIPYNRQWSLILCGSAQDLNLGDFGFLDPDPQKYADPDPRGKINQKLKKKNIYTLKTQIWTFVKKRDYKNFLISEWFIKFYDKNKRKKLHKKINFFKSVNFTEMTFKWILSTDG